MGILWRHIHCHMRWLQYLRTPEMGLLAGIGRRTGRVRRRCCRRGRASCRSGRVGFLRPLWGVVIWRCCCCDDCASGAGGWLEVWVYLFAPRICRDVWARAIWYTPIHAFNCSIFWTSHKQTRKCSQYTDADFEIDIALRCGDMPRSLRSPHPGAVM